MRPSALYISVILTLSVLSCDKDDIIAYHTFSIGKMEGAAFVTDENVRLVAAPEYAASKIEGKDRFILISDIIRRVEGQENTFEVNPRMTIPVLTKKVLPESAYKEGESLPCGVISAWKSGGYINIHNKFLHVPATDSIHKFNLVVDERLSSADTAVVTLMHVIVPRKKQGSEHTGNVADIYASFSTEDFPSGFTGNIKIRWSWFDGPAKPGESPIKGFSGVISR